MTEDETVPSRLDDQRRDVMKAPDDVSAMLRLKAAGWGSKRIAAELGCSRNTVRHWLALGSWRPCATPSRSTQLDGLSDWLCERFRRHADNADVVRQELAREKNIIARAACMSAPTATRSKITGSTAWRVLSVPSAVWRAKFCSTTPGR